ncbi:MAG TPA: GNAT family N-acetyltransferase [Gaiellaceae bacterium]|nr:GNAT family N-acetyltransferase [Gaiellaceae bacterium]
MEIRPAFETDLAAAHAVFRRSIEELYARHRFEPPRPPQDVFVRQHAHLLKHDAGRFWVATAEERLVGFAAAFVREDTWFLSALFVSPEHQAQGVGRQLLARVWGGSKIRRRIAIVDAIQPVSTGLYSLAGLLPVTPLMSLAGEPRTGPGHGLDPGRLDDAALAELDRAAYGFDRAPEHAFWRAEARGTLWQAAGEPVAYSYRWPGGRLGPVAGRTPEACGRALEAELERAQGRFVSLVVPASARPALSAALGAGLRYRDPPGLILSTDPAGPDSLVPHGYSLF